MIAILSCKVRAIAIPDIHGLSEPLGALMERLVNQHPLVMICCQGCLGIMSRRRSMFGSHAGFGK
jgi:hypothetical protein